MVEGPGHVPLDQIAFNMKLEQQALRRRAVLCPRTAGDRRVSRLRPHHQLPSARPRRREHGAAMLCYVTPKEHVGLPKADDVKQGCIAYKIAAHAGDVARGIAGRATWDDDLSRARAALNWRKHFELAFDGDTARAYHDEDLDVDTDFCAMCGHDWCSMRISKEIVEFASGKDPDFQPERRVQRSPGFEKEPHSLRKEIVNE